MKKLLLLALSVAALTGCKKDADPDPNETMYFPATSSTVWDTTSKAKLNWHLAAIEPLKQFLSDKHSRSFMILVNGRIAMEEYFNGHTATAEWEWNSAGKTLVATTIGICMEKGLLGLQDKISKHLGTGWTNMPLEKENLITVRHLLTMSSGIDDTKQLVIKNNLTYVSDAGTRWAYGNVFQKLIDVTDAAAGKPFEAYFNEHLKNKIGMDGYWNFGTIFSIYHSTTRSMARFGLLALNKGAWMNQQVINQTYFQESTSTSQSINPSYGYLWWLNGKSKFMIPNEQTVFSGALIPNAPSDLYAAMGANDQRIYVIPSRKMVIVRMGDASNPDDPNFAVSGFDAALWDKINAVIN